MSIDFYHTDLSPPCRIVRMVAQHLNVELNLKPVDLQSGQHLKPEFQKINPAQCLPTIVDNGFILWESRAIAQYLCNKYAPDSDLYPKDPKDRANVDRMLYFDMSLYSSAGKSTINETFTGIKPTEEDFTALNNNLKLLDTLIGSNGYVASNKLTIADLSIAISITVLRDTDYDFSEYSNVKQWFDRITNELTYFEEINGKVKEAFKMIKELVEKNKNK